MNLDPQREKRNAWGTEAPSLSLSTPQSSTGACFGQTQPESRNPRAQAKRSYSTHRAGHRRAEMCVGDTRGNPEGREADRDPAEQSSSLQPFWHHTNFLFTPCFLLRVSFSFSTHWVKVLELSHTHSCSRVPLVHWKRIQGGFLSSAV